MNTEAIKRLCTEMRPFDFSFSGVALIEAAGYKCETRVQVQWSATEGGTAAFDDPTFRLDAITRPGAPNQVVPRERRLAVAGSTSSGVHWRLHDGTWANKQTHSGIDGRRDSYVIAFERVVEVVAERREGAFQVIVVADFNPNVLNASGEPPEITGFVNAVLGSEVALVSMIMKDSAGSAYVALVIESSNELTDAKLDSALALLSFIGGRIVRLAAVGSYTSGGEEISRRLFPHAARGIAPRPPFRLQYPRLAVQHLPEKFGEMLEAMFAYRNSPTVELPAAISHLLVEAPYLDVELRDLALALDTLIESERFSPGDIPPIVPVDIFAAAAAPLIDALRSRMSANAVDRVKSIINGLNSNAHSVRRDMFWKFVGFDPSEEERKAYRHRHPMSHSGFINIPTLHFDDSWQNLIYDAARLRTMVNRCILALLGWNYPVMDCLTFQDAPFPKS